jgi:glutathione S-transferase
MSGAPSGAVPIRVSSTKRSVAPSIARHRSFLCGDRLTLADIPTGTTLCRYFGLEIDRPHIPHVEAWYGRLKERPAYRQHVMIPFDDLYGRLDY